MKIVKSREQSRLLIKGISETIKNEQRKVDFFQSKRTKRWISFNVIRNINR